jgi:MFS family permease
MSISMPYSSDVAPRPFAALLLPIMAVVLVGFLIIGVALPVLPLHVHDGLGLSTFVVGLVTGVQFAASLVSRFWSGNFADRRGGKSAVLAGLVAAAVAGLLYLVSLVFVKTPVVSVSILLVGRGVLGGAESFIITGAMSWGLVLAGPQNTGKVIAWVGTAMFAAFALGAPVGMALYASLGFQAIALATMLAPLATILVVAPLASVPAQPRVRASVVSVAGAVWIPGVGAALSSIGFGSIIAFTVLLFADRGWNLGWLAVTAFASALIVARLLLGHLADRVGGAKVAFVFVLVEAAGQALVWLAPAAWMALAGAAVTGFGYALVYPAFGVEAVRRAPPESRGLAMGTYTAFLDLALVAAGPALGLIANGAGIGAVYLASFIVVLSAAPVALWLQRAPERSTGAGRSGTADERI